MFDDFDDAARVWIFAADKTLSDEQAANVSNAIADFLDEWAAHGKALNAAVQVFHNRFAVVCANEAEVKASGCSVDALFRAIREVFERSGTLVADSSNIFYQDGEEVFSISRPAFKQLVEQKAVNGNTPVFDNSLTTLAAMRTGSWNRAYKDSWHAQLFGEL
ncbi:MAG: hypothetical protein KDD66_04920 [Bdellovibrionales bacterium]|nr:hypothetical protein [Bdellovibrionales bacterium]